MVHDSFDGIAGISDGQPNDDGAWSSNVMHHACSRDCVLGKLIGKDLGKSVTIDILLHSFACLLHGENVAISYFVPVPHLRSLLEDT